MNNAACNLLLVEDNPGDARLVRELLAEYQAGRSSQVHSEVGKKSWWRRK